MSYIDYTRRSYSSAYEITVCITKGECETLLPFFKKAYKEIKLKHDKYQDIHEGGEATEKQEDKRIKYLSQLENLESILLAIETIKD